MHTRATVEGLKPLETRDATCVLVEMTVPNACAVLLQEQCGSYTFIPYVVSPQGKVFACDTAMMMGIKDLMQPSFQLEPLLTLLVERLVHLLNNVQIQSRSGIP